MLQLKSLNDQLTDLRMAFDEAIVEGNSFSAVKKIYLQIKLVEKLIAERQLELLSSPDSDGRLPFNSE